MRKEKYFIVILLLTFALIGCGKKSPPLDVGVATPNDFQIEPSRDYLGVITEIDTEKATLSVYDVSQNQSLILNYTGATNFLSPNNKQMTAAQIELGDVVDVYIDLNTDKVLKVQSSSDIFIDKNVQKVLVNSNENYLDYQNRKFKYNDKGIVVFSDGQLIDIKEVSPMDVVTVRGVEGFVYSIVVDAGHGYIRPEDYDSFVGGRMTISGETMIDISKNMLVPIREGSYEVTMKKGNFIGTRSITVPRNVEVKMNMSIFKNQAPNVGQVVFDISPEGAIVYVDNKEVDVSVPVSLSYGKHKVVVALEGYTTYSGMLDVQSANPTVKVDLAEENVKITDVESSNKSNETVSNSELVYDNERKITVNEPTGVEVYLNGIYKGISPISFPKVVGTQTITLSKSGYTTKSYTVEIVKDNEDISWNFAKLMKN